MAAPNIPNLLSLRGKPTAGRGRGGISGRSEALRPGKTAPPPPGDPDEQSAEKLRAKNDMIVQATDTDANISRMSAVEAGYLVDPFAETFAAPGSVQKRFPIINRGTYARTTAVDRLVDDFLSSLPEIQKQIISLGAGSDTRYFRLMSRSSPPDVLYHELDFPVNTSRKLSVIASSPALKALVGDPLIVRSGDSELHGPHYHMHAVDLRALDFSRPWVGPVSLNHIDPALPTLLISECCLTYMEPDEADSVVRYFATKVLAAGAPLGLVLYEPINPFDSFGKVMVANLAQRGIVLQTLHKYCSLSAQRERMRAYGLKDGQKAVDVDFLQEWWIEEREKKRIARVEMLDEVEELNLLAKHYCVAWGWRDGSEEFRGLWDAWRRLEELEE